MSEGEASLAALPGPGSSVSSREGDNGPRAAETGASPADLLGERADLLGESASLDQSPS